MDAFHNFASVRVETLTHSLAFYARPQWRQQRRKAHIKGQRWEARLVAGLSRVARDADMKVQKKLVAIAWGSWGAQSGGPRHRGLPPTLQMGLMRMLARHFVVVVTPEAGLHTTYTNKTKTCHKCNSNSKQMHAVRVARRARRRTAARRRLVRNLPAALEPGRQCRAQHCREWGAGLHRPAAAVRPTARVGAGPATGGHCPIWARGGGPGRLHPTSALSRMTVTVEGALPIAVVGHKPQVPSTR